MMNGLVPITNSEFEMYFEESPDFVCVYVPEFYHLIAVRKESNTIAAYKDANGECFTRTMYWKIL